MAEQLSVGIGTGLSGQGGDGLTIGLDGPFQKTRGLVQHSCFYNSVWISGNTADCLCTGWGIYFIVSNFVYALPFPLWERSAFFLYPRVTNFC